MLLKRFKWLYIKDNSVGKSGDFIKKQTKWTPLYTYYYEL